MTLNEYQTKTKETAIYPGQGTVAGLTYCALGLGEVGELQGKVKKILRDHNGETPQSIQNAIFYELGDVLWYIARTAEELGVSLEDVAIANINKLVARKEKGTLKGSGDER